MDGRDHKHMDIVFFVLKVHYSAKIPAQPHVQVRNAVYLSAFYYYYKIMIIEYRQSKRNRLLLALVHGKVIFFQRTRSWRCARTRIKK